MSCDSTGCCPYKGDIRWDTQVEVIVGGLTDDERRKLASIEWEATKNSAGAGLVSDENGALSISNEVVEKIDSKADNITFDPLTRSLQLMSNGELIGDAVTIFEGEGAGIISMEINEDGELIVRYDDGRTVNLGVVKGVDGKDGDPGAVYVPHIDSHKVLTWTIEDEAGDVPEPVDMLPDDEWSDIDDESKGRTDYVWDTL